MVGTVGAAWVELSQGEGPRPRRRATAREPAWRAVAPRCEEVTARRRGRRPHGSSGAVAAQDDTDPVAPKEAVEPLTRRSTDRAARGRVECVGGGGEGRASGSRRGMPFCPTGSSDQLSVVRLGAAPWSSGSTDRGRPLDGLRARCAFASDHCGWTRGGAASWQGDVDVVGPGRLSMPPLGGAATLEGVWTTRFGVCLASAYCSPSRHERPRPARAVHEAAAGVRQEDEEVPPNRGFDSERESG